MAAGTNEAVARIDRDELIELTLDICNIDSQGPTEAPVADRVATWLETEGFGVRRIGLLADRYNVLGKLAGSGGGYSLIFNSHMDTAVRERDVWTHRDPGNPEYHSAWIDDDELVGEGVVNDKGPMAAFLIAAKAVKAAGVPLKGDLLVSAVVGETSHEPSDGPPGEIVESQDLGARFLVTHGGIADYALIAEGTGFSIVSVEAGLAWFKITWLSDAPAFYTPYLPDRTSLSESPNMIVRAAAAIEALERWAAEYQAKYSYQSACGPFVPKAQIGAIRSGHSTSLNLTPQVCSLYLGAFTPPGHDPLALRDEIARALAEAGLPASEIDLYLFRRGYEARGADRLIEAVTDAHRTQFGAEPPPPNPATNSMWRDINIFNEVGIPAITYGPRSERHSFRRSLKIESLHQAACVYARTICDICMQEKPRGLE